MRKMQLLAGILFVSLTLHSDIAIAQNPAAPAADVSVDSLYQQAKEAMDNYVGSTVLVDTAIPVGKELVRLFPDSPYGHYVLSRCSRYLSYYSGDNYDHEKITNEALPYAEKAVELGTNMSLMHMNLAMCYFCLSEYAKALEIMNKAVDLSENEEARSFNLVHKGIILTAKGDYQEALTVFKQAEKGPMSQLTQISMLDKLSGLYKKTGKYDEAIAASEKRLAIDPDNHWGKHNLAITYERKAKELIKENFDLEEAERLLFKALELKENNSTYRWLAQCYYKMGEYDKSMEYVNILLSRDPANEWALKKKDTLRSKAGE